MTPVVPTIKSSVWPFFLAKSFETSSSAWAMAPLTITLICAAFAPLASTSGIAAAIAAILCFNIVLPELADLDFHQLGWRAIGRHPHGRARRTHFDFQIADFVIRRG